MSENGLSMPSVTTNTRVTSKFGKIRENAFLQSVFKSSEDSKKHFVLLDDEMYVQKMLKYHGRFLFGK